MAAEKDNTAKTHVLHVDDDPDIRLLISASLRDFGYVVATAGTKAEALELAKQFKFDLCILDVRLPRWQRDRIVPTDPPAAAEGTRALLFRLRQRRGTRSRSLGLRRCLSQETGLG